MASRNEISTLREKYDAVGFRTWREKDFLPKNLSSSLDLFTEESLKVRQPDTKNLHVIALVFGLPFQTPQILALQKFQSDILPILNGTMHYFVKPENFGLELCVLKWPSEKQNSELVSSVTAKLLAMSETGTRGAELYIDGIQVNPDGCIVARGFDRDGWFRSLRSSIVDEVQGMPVKQSGWVHIPLGRILEPLGADRFKMLKDYVFASRSMKMMSFGNAGSLSLVDEKKWYMESHQIITTFFN